MTSADVPLVAIAGRPNVGKSTLFNRLAGRRLALVADTPGVTRDRNEAEAVLRGRTVRLADTAGLDEAPPESLAGRMHAGAATTLAQAALVLFVVDARDGLTPADRHFAAWLRRLGRPVLLVANKAEGRGGGLAAMEAFALGLGEPIAISAEHGEGISDLMHAVAERLPDPAGSAEEAPERPLRLAIVGRPNAGKSTLLNRLSGEARALAGPEPGITRDAIMARLTDAEGPIELVDTAGLRRRARVEPGVERAATGAAIEALKLAEVVALVIDAPLGLHDQDLAIGRLIAQEGRAGIVVLNKWDAIADRGLRRQAIEERLAVSLPQMAGISLLPLSALTGAGVERLLPAVRAAHAIWNRRVPTAELNRWFEQALERHAPPLIEGRRLKLRYITQPKARPPTFVLFGTRAEQMPDAYRRYLVNGLRAAFDLPGTPIRLQVRGTANPFAP